MAGKAILISSDPCVRPGTHLYWWLGHATAGASPLAFHVGSLGIHLVTACLLCMWLTRFGLTARAATAGLLFLIAQSGMEAVIWPAAAGHLLAGFGTMAALCGLSAYRTSGWIGYRVLLWLGFLLAILSKEACVTLPAILLAADWLLHRPGAWRLHAWLWGVAGAYYTWEYLGFIRHVRRAELMGAETVESRLSRAVCGLHEMLTRLALPRELDEADLDMIQSADVAAVALAGVLLAAMGVLAVAWARRDREGRLATFCLLWLALAWLPYSQTVYTGDFPSRYQYAPLLPVTALAALLLFRRPLWSLGWIGLAALAVVNVIGHFQYVSEGREDLQLESLRQMKISSQGTVYLWSPTREGANVVPMIQMETGAEVRDVSAAFTAHRLRPEDRVLTIDHLHGWFLDLTDPFRHLLQRVPTSPNYRPELDEEKTAVYRWRPSMGDADRELLGIERGGPAPWLQTDPNFGNQPYWSPGAAGRIRIPVNLPASKVAAVRLELHRLSPVVSNSAVTLRWVVAATTSPQRLSVCALFPRRPTD